MADTSRRIAGLGSLTVDGVMYAITDGSYRPSDVTREVLTSMTSGFDGYKETLQPGQIKATVRRTPGVRVKDFRDMTNVSVTLTLATGETVSGTGMCTVETQEVSLGEATFDVTFQGEDVEESA